MKQFAKLFDRPKYGQVVMMLGTDDDKPELQCFVKPDGLGVCQVAIGFGEWAPAEKALAEADEAFADQVAAAIFEPMKLQPNTD